MKIVRVHNVMNDLSKERGNLLITVLEQDRESYLKKCRGACLQDRTTSRKRVIIAFEDAGSKVTTLVNSVLSNSEYEHLKEGSMYTFSTNIFDLVRINVTSINIVRTNLEEAEEDIDHLNMNARLYHYTLDVPQNYVKVLNTQIKSNPFGAGGLRNALAVACNNLNPLGDTELHHIDLEGAEFIDLYKTNK